MTRPQITNATRPNFIYFESIPSAAVKIPVLITIIASPFLSVVALCLQSLEASATVMTMGENTTEAEPVREINGEIYILTPVSPNQQRFSSDLSPVTSKTQIAFSEKNLTGYEILPQGTFSPSETGL